MRICVIAITSGGARLGLRLHKELNGVELFVSSRYAAQVETSCREFEPTELKVLITSTWREFDAFILIMATGIVVRMIAPLLESKQSDPAVVVMDDAGRFAVALLSGHLGGANRLAGLCGSITGATPVITTATDANSLPSFDMLAQELGLVIDDISCVKHLNTLLLDHKAIAVIDPEGKTRNRLGGCDKISFHGSMGDTLAGDACGVLLISNRIERNSSLPLLILRPRNLVLGIGCNRGTPADEIAAFVANHLLEQSLSPLSIRCMATVEAKRDEAGLTEYAQQLAVPLLYFTAEQLNQVSFPSPRSEHALKAVGAAGVAEPAALLASEGGTLLLNKVKSTNVTLAIAEQRGV